MYTEFKFRQERKRRRLHFQRSLSPTEFENATLNVVATLPPKLATCEDLNVHDDLKHKAYFLHKIGLMPTLPEHRKSRHFSFISSFSLIAQGIDTFSNDFDYSRPIMETTEDGNNE